MAVVFTGAVLSVLERMSDSFSSSAGLLVLFVVVVAVAGAGVACQSPAKSALSKRRGIYVTRVACLGFMFATVVISCAVWGIAGALAANESIRGFDWDFSKKWMFVGGVFRASLCCSLQ
jgi:hypothetical protein